MDQINLKSFVAKLNDTSRRTLEAAAGLCLSRTNYNVEIEHWLLKLLEAPNTDLAALLRHFEIDPSRVTRDLTRVVDGFKTGNARTPSLSPNIVSLIREAWVIASIEFGSPRIRSAYLLCALLSEKSLGMVAYGASSEFEKIDVAALHRDLRDVTANTDEAQSEYAATVEPAAGQPGQPLPPGGPTKTPALDQFTVNLTERARRGEIDPVLGRDREIRQIIDILTRRRQNNPIMTGEAGVGKTAVVEGFALRVAAGDVPPSLAGVDIRTLDLGLLQAGAGIKGEFENRLKSVIDEVKRSPKPIIIFIDEAHTMIGAGGAAGQGDAANLLKPALARGELRTIAATTWAEYKKYFEKDAALARRFQVVKVEEPTEEVCQEMMRGLVGVLEQHHRVRILDEAVVDTVRLSHRYISGRQLPDKAVSLLDTAAARVAIGHNATPPAIEDARRRIDQLALAIEILYREGLSGAANQERLDELRGAKEATETELAALGEQWEQERDLVARMREIRDRLESGAPAQAQEPAAAGETSGPAAPAAEAPAKPEASAPTEPAPLSPEEAQRLRDELQALTAQLKSIQGENPLMDVCVDSQAIAAVVSAWTGIPVGRMVTDEVRTVLALKETMGERVIGQPYALEAIAQRIRTSRANL
ncbi:MAG: AAA family ATPase, partial [Planctomycetia bacterium]|nr:AAA family ATPase [Planctomycetia bacterium]